MSRQAAPERDALVVRSLGEVAYQDALARMQDFTAQRDSNTADELWLLSHPPVYTLGISCRQSTLGATDIPVVKTDRGGQMTYHGPGQLIAYALLDLRRRGRGIKWLVRALEQVAIDLLCDYEIDAERRDGAPGVYTGGRKIAALGLRVRRGCSYHGLSLNVNMDLGPFDNIHPCGYEGLQVTSLRELGVNIAWAELEQRIAEYFASLLSYRL